LLADPPSADESALLAAAAPLVQERMSVLAEAVDLLGFLFVDEAAFTVHAEAAARQLGEPAAAVLEAAVAVLSPLPSGRRPRSRRRSGPPWSTGWA